MQRKIVKAKDGQCSAAKELSIDTSSSTVTQTPVRRSTLEKESERDLFDLVDETSIDATESSLNANLYTNLYEEDRPNFNPMFGGRSYLKLTRLESSGYLKLEIELVAFSDKGIIFYNGQSNKGVGDFISLTLNNGYFEYRFNLGSGVSTLKSKEKVVRYVPTKVVLIKDYKKGKHFFLIFKLNLLSSERYPFLSLNQGVLIVNDREEVSCIAEGNWKSLDLNENFFLGYVRTDYEKIYENLNGIRTGFVGCLMKLELGKNDRELKSVVLSPETSKVDLDEKATTSILLDRSATANGRLNKMKVLESESIENCSSLSKNSINFCLKHNPCSKGSICVNLIDNTFDCICPFNDKCMGLHERADLLLNRPEDQSSNNVYTLDFWTESWIKSKNLLVNVARAFSIELWFLTRSKDGLLIYAQKTKKGDFLSLNIKNSKLEFIFDLGSKIPNVRYDHRFFCC